MRRALPVWFTLLACLAAPGAHAQLPTLIRGQLITPDGQPLRDAEVSHEYGWEPTTRTDARGRFVLVHDPDSHARIVLGGKRYARTLVEVPASGFLGVVLMEPAGLVVGRVTDSEGNAVAGAEVTIRDGLRGRLRWRVVDERFTFETSTHTDADGSFRAFGAVRSLQDVEVRAAGFERQTRSAVSAMEPVDFTLRPGDPGSKPVRLLRGIRVPAEQGELVVQTVAAGTGRPLPEARVRVWWRHTTRTRRAPGAEYLPLAHLPAHTPEDDGCVTLRGPEGFDAVVEASAPGYGTRRLVIQPTGSTVPLELEPEAVLRGAVRSKLSGESFVGAAVHLLPLASESASGPALTITDHVTPAARTDAHGEYEIRGLSAGRYALYLSCAPPHCPPSALGTAHEIASLTPGETTILRTLDVDPRPALRVELEAGARPVDWPLGLAWAAETVGGDGREATVPPAPETLTRWTDDRASWFDVPRGPRRIHALIPQAPRLGAPWSIELTRFTYEGEPLEVTLPLAQRGPRHVRGRFVCSGSPPARDRLVVVAEKAMPGNGGFHGLRLFGPASRLARDGAFEFQLEPGIWDILLVDAATGVVLHREPQVDTEPYRSVVLSTIESHTHRLDFRCAGSDEGLTRIHHFEVRCDRPDLRGVGRLRDMRSLGDWRIDRGTGVPAQRGEPLFEVFVPEGEVWIAARPKRGKDPLAEVTAAIPCDEPILLEFH